MSKSNKKIIITLIFFAIVSLLYFKEPLFIAKLKYPIQYQSQVIKFSNDYNVDKNLVFSVIKAESNFYPYAKSKKNAMGLMQILDTTWNWGCSELNTVSTDYYDINQNIEIGTWYLNKLINEFGREEIAIMAYNAGSGNVKSWIDQGLLSGNDYKTWDIPFKETRDYLDKVMTYKNKYNEIY